jgi:hypothetical protein
MKAFVCLLFTFLFFGVFAFAQEAAPVVEIPVSTFLEQVLAIIAKFGGLSTVLKISAIVGIMVASMKVSFLRQYVWAKLGAAQVLVAPVLGIIIGILDLFGAGTVTLASVMAYMGSGAGAILLHQLLDGLKKMGFVGDKYKAVIDWIMEKLKADKSADK